MRGALGILGRGVNARNVIVVLAVVGCLMMVFGCGSAQQPSLDRTVGYWQAANTDTWVVSGAGGEFLMHVTKRGSTYYLAINSLPPKPAKLVDGRIELPWTGSAGRAAEFGMNRQSAAVFGWVNHGMDAETGESTPRFWWPFPVKRLTAAAYEIKAAAKADGFMYDELMRLDYALREWSDRHHGQPPVAGDVQRDSAFGQWLQTQWIDVEGGVPWPTNPYAGTAMHAGSGPGGFSYSRNGDSYTLTGRLHDGTVFSTADEPPS